MSATETISDAFEALPNVVQTDLFTWLNITELDDADRQLLADLYNAGRFGAWDCPRCQSRVYCGAPEDWDHFQGVLQVDYVSYPVSHTRPETWCDNCRSLGQCYDESGHPIGVMPWDDPETFSDI